MKTLQTVLITLVAVLALTAAAEASVDLWTPALFVETDSIVECKLTNVTTLTRTMQIRLYDENGNLVGHFGPVPVDPLVPVVVDSAPGGGYYTCRFTVPSKAYVRAAATIFAATGSETDRVAVPAQ